MFAQNFRRKERPAGLMSIRDGPKKTICACNARHKIVLDGPAFNQPGILRRRESRNGTPSNRAGQADI